MFLELAHAAGKRERSQHLRRVLRQRLRLDAELARALLQEVPGERRNVLEPLAQRRQPKANDIEAMQQILAKEALTHALLEVLVRRSDHANARLLRRMTANPVVLAVGEHAQQSHLQIRRHVADLVEEERTALGLLEPAPARALRSGERAALVPEELDSSRSFGIAAVLIAMNGPGARGLCRCSARATSSLPVPDSPVTSTVALDCDSRPIARNTSCIAGAWPSISAESPPPAASIGAAAGACTIARRISATA
jgi:hypothetical protein